MSKPSPLDDATSRRLQRQPRVGTGPEVALRRELWRRGLRYRIDLPVIGRRRRVDIAFTRAKVAVFVDGCFWHSCPIHGTMPKNNRVWWQEKLAANVRRDRDTDATLAEAGWRVLRTWEHEDPKHVAGVIEKMVRASRD